MAKVKMFMQRQDGDIKEFKEIIDNVKIVQRKDSPIIGIVQAEALYYFDGQKV